MVPFCCLLVPCVLNGAKTGDDPVDGNNGRTVSLGSQGETAQDDHPRFPGGIHRYGERLCLAVDADGSSGSVREFVDQPIEEFRAVR